MTARPPAHGRRSACWRCRGRSASIVRCSTRSASRRSRCAPPAELGALDALILPGGESTTMSKLLDSSAVRAPLGELLADGLPVFGTCAGMILLAREVVDGRPDQQSFGVDRRRGAPQRVRPPARLVRGRPRGRRARRGRRSPACSSARPASSARVSDVEVLATYDGLPVLARQGAVVVASFHPELSGDLRLHERFLQGAS